MEWTAQQVEALERIDKFLKNPRQKVFKLHGMAGTGKSTLMPEAGNLAGGTVVYGAPTGKAALRLREAGCHNANTLHSLMYEVIDEFATPLEWRLRHQIGTDGAKLVAVDEASMVGPDIGRDLEDVTRKLLVVGDPMQLPPVKGEGHFMTKPDMLLTDIRRQAEDNPIIQLSLQLREGQDLAEGQYGDTVVASRYDLPKGLMLEHDIVICGTNLTRHRINTKFREHRGWGDPASPKVGDRLVCLKNNRELGLMNGSLWDVLGVEIQRRPKVARMQIQAADGLSAVKTQVLVPIEFFEGLEDGLDKRFRARHQEFTYGYALTCHKSQGSQWDKVFVVDEARVFKDFRYRWMYTAVTRAAKSLTVAQ